MRGTSLRRLFTELKAPLSRALHLIRPDSKQIHTAWRRKLCVAGLTEEEIEILSSVALDDQNEHLQAANFEAYHYDLERLALALESKGLTEAQVILGLGLYLECCLPYLFAAGQKGKEPAVALAGMVAATDTTLLGSY